MVDKGSVSVVPGHSSLPVEYQWLLTVNRSFTGQRFRLRYPIFCSDSKTVGYTDRPRSKSAYISLFHAGEAEVRWNFVFSRQHSSRLFFCLRSLELSSFYVFILAFFDLSEHFLAECV